jgi:hypothetical protein
MQNNAANDNRASCPEMLCQRNMSHAMTPTISAN